MKVLITLICLLATFTSFSQLIEGDLLDEGRKLAENRPFIIEGHRDGWAKYDLAVNRLGEVTSAKLVGSNLKSTPSKMKIRDYVMGYKFEPGTYYPKFHHVTVKITSIVPIETEEEK